jgi:predicted ATPase/DNA-binding SARP family transcriptional activator
MARLSLSLLGPARITLDGQPVDGFSYHKARALLVYLAVEAGRPHPRDALVGLLWPELPDAAARTNLRQALANVREVIGDARATPPFLLATRDTIQLNPASDYALDVAAFSGLLAACEAHAHRGLERCRSCAARMAQALDMYRGDFLAEFSSGDSAPFEEWQLLHRERLHQRALDALTRLAGYHERRGDDERARHYAQRQLDLDPWHEEAHRQLMRLLAASGQRSAALAQYERCRDVLSRELGVAPAAETTAQYERIRDSMSAELPTAGRETHHSQSFPTPPTPLVGREQELAELGTLLEDPAHRLITIAGPGGIGKTRLALAAAAEQAEIFAGGAAFVPLAAVSAAAFVAPAILGALGVALHGQRDPREQLRAYLCPKELLLVLDNLEQLLAPEQSDGDGLADMLVDLLQHAPGVTLLVTSRERLQLPGEWLFDLAGLRYPSGEPGWDVAAYGAVQLFVQRARQVRRQFALDGEAHAVARICRLVEGMPLAIELAAAALRGRSCAAVAAAIQTGISALATGLRAVPERHRSIVATFEYSWRLLDEQGRQVLARLSVFRGGFDEEAAVQVAQATPELLAALLDKSLLRWDGTARYDMHELVRQYADEKLEQAGEVEAVRRRHAEHYLALAEQLEHGLAAQSQPASWLAPLLAEADNLRAAFAWSQTSTGDRELGLRLAVALDLYWVYRAQSGEGSRWLAELLADEATHTAAPREMLLRAHAKALRIAGNEAETQFGRMAEARALLEESAQLHLSLGETHDAAMSQWALAHMYWTQGAHERAAPVCEESLRGFQAAGDMPGVGYCLWLLSNIAREQGDLQRALTFTEANYAQSQELQLPLNLGYTLLEMSRVRLAMGDIAAARPAVEAALALAPNVHYQLLVHASLQLGRVAQAEGGMQQAAALSEQALEIAREKQNLRALQEALLEVGWLEHQQGNEERAVALLTESLQLYRDRGHRGRIADCLAGLAGVYQAKARTATDAFRVVRLYGAAHRGYLTSPGLLLQRERTGYAHELAAIRTRLDEPSFAAAWAEGQAMTLEEAVAEALGAEAPR